MDVFDGSGKEHVDEKLISQEGMKVGAINGAFALLLLFGSYAMGLETFVNINLYSTFLPYMIIVIIISGIQLRRRLGNYLSFRSALRFSFLAYVVAALMVAVATYILYNVIDRELTEKAFQIGLDKSRAMMERLGAPDEQIDEALEGMQKEKKETNLRTIFVGTGFSLIWDFVKSLLIALVIRREKPAFEQF